MAFVSTEALLSERTEKIPTGTYWTVKPAMVLLESDAIEKGRDKDSSFLGVTTDANNDPSGALLQVCEKIEERNRERRSEKYRIKR